MPPGTCCGLAPTGATTGNGLNRQGGQRRHDSDAKPSPTNPQGGVTTTEAGIHISNVMVVDGAGNATRVGRRKGDDGKLVRFSKKTNEELK